MNNLLVVLPAVSTGTMEPKSNDCLTMSSNGLHQLNGGAIALTGQPRLHGKRLSREDSGQELLDLFAKRGSDFLLDIEGPFSIVLYDQNNGLCLIAIDRAGIERLAWGSRNNQYAFGTSVEQVAEVLSDSPTIDQQAIFDFMLGHMVAAPRTIFEGVEKLLPGSAIEFSESGFRHLQYWQPDFDGMRRNGQDLLPEVLPALSRGIANSGVDQTTGSFLSGGLDSSTVTGLMTELGTSSGKAFSVGFGVKEFDELAFARAASTHFNCEHHEYEVTPDDIVESVPLIASAYDEPFGNSSAVPALSCARLAKRHGIDHLLAGDGGDEIFGGNERYVQQRVFEHYRKIPKALRRSIFDPVASWFHAERSLLPFRKYSSYVNQSNISLPERYESWNLIYREGPSTVFSRALLEQVDTEMPLNRMREVWESCPSNDLLDRMLWYDWKYILADNDLRKVTKTCELAGVRVSFPMLDKDFVDLSIKIPSSAKIANGELRSFFRQSVKNFLPNAILTKDKHGFGLPFGQWLKTHQGLQELVYSSLTALKRRGIINPEFIDRIVKEHKTGHASYYGYAIWDLVTLEQWLQQRANPALSSFSI